MSKTLYYLLDKKGRRSFKLIDSKNKEILKNSFVLQKLNLDIFKRKISDKDILNFFIKLKLFTENKYGFYESLKIFDENENIYPYVKRIRKELEKGKSLAKSFEESGLLLKSIDIAMLKVGEETGNLSLAFEGIEKRLKDKLNEKLKIKKIMIYPCIVFSMIFILLYLLGNFVLPTFIEVVEGQGGDLPLITKSIIYVSNNMLKIIFFIFVILVFVKKIFKTYSENIISFLMKIKFIRKIGKIYFIISYLKLMTILLESGLSFSRGTEVVIKANKSKYNNIKLKRIYKNINEGRSIYEALKDIRIFSLAELELLRVGEDSGRLTEVFTLIYTDNERRLQEKIDVLIKLLEPLTILIIGLIIGGIFLGIYLPILNLIESI